MDLDLLKKKFSKKASVNIKDVDIALKAVPFLVREIEKLETLLAERDKQIVHLSAQLKRKVVLSKSGAKGNAAWSVNYDEMKNILYVQLEGKFTYSSAKSASNAVISILPNMRKDFCVITDIRQIRSSVSMKTFFHLKKAMFTMKQYGVKKMVRIIDADNKLLESLAVGTSKLPGIDFDVAFSRKEAEEKINLNRDHLQV